MAVSQSASIYPEILSESNVQRSIEDELKVLSELELPAEDGIPLETNWHRIEMNLLIDSVHSLWHDRSDYFTGGNMFIYFSLEQVRNRDYRGPDFFVVKGVDGTRNRDSWIVWREDGRYPDVIEELASSSTLDIDLGFKKQLYERTFRTPEYFCYDPNENQLQGWRLGLDEYVSIDPNEQGWLWSQEMDVWLGLWQGEFQRVNAVWLRFYASDGRLVLTRSEAEAQRADAEAQRAEVEAQRADAAEAELARLRDFLAKHDIPDDKELKES
jgi:Uma2 family endonuclease